MPSAEPTADHQTVARPAVDPADGLVADPAADPAVPKAYRPAADVPPAGEGERRRDPAEEKSR
ncbi:MAG TPA: hypothetical protein VIG75_04675, partial [Citricoccus sp.]